MMNKRGDLTGEIYLIASIGAFAIFLIIASYIVQEVSGELVNYIGISEEINNSLGASSAVAEHTLPTLWLIMFVGLMFGVFVTSYFVPTHPVFAPVFVLLLIIAILIAIPISDAYVQLTEIEQFQATSIQQTLILFLMSNLPFIALIVGLIAMILSYAKPDGAGMVLN